MDLDYLDDVQPAGEFQSTPGTYGDDPAESAFARGEQLYVMGRFDLAARAFEQAVHVSPRFLKAHAALVDAVLALGQVDRGEALAEDLLKKFNRNTDLGTARAHAYLERYRVRREEEDHESADFHYGLAKEFCKIATDATPGSSYAWLRSGEVALAKRTPGAPRTAQRSFNTALSCDRNWMTETKIGRIWAEWGWYNEAQQWLADAARTSPNRAGVWYWLGMAYLGGDRAGEAKGCFRKALGLQPQYEEARQALTQCSAPNRLARRIKSWFGSR